MWRGVLRLILTLPLFFMLAACGGGDKGGKGSTDPKLKDLKPADKGGGGGEPKSTEIK